MPRYEIVAHVSLELEGTTPEAAAAAFRRDLLAGADGAVALRGLAVWRPASETTPAPLPVPLQRQLADFFAGVARCAAAAEEAFRGRVEHIFASAGPDAIPDARAGHPGVRGGGEPDCGWPRGGGLGRGAIARHRDEARSPR